MGDYASERLGLGARILEEEARVALRLRRLPRITAAFLEGSLNWTAVRLIVGVASECDEESWIEQAASLDTRALAGLVRVAGGGGAASGAASGAAGTDAAVGAGAPSAGDPVAADFLADGLAARRGDGVALRSRLAGRVEDEDDEDDPRQRWAVRVSHGGRRLWRAACEMASRTAGRKLTPAEVLEQVAAEASSGDAGAMFARWRFEEDRDRESETGRTGSSTSLSIDPPAECPTGSSAECSTQAQSSSSAAPGRGRLVELLAAKLERNSGAPAASSLRFLTLEDALELEERDPQLAAFYADLLADTLDGQDDGGRGRGGQAPPPAPPEHGWFERALREIGRAEGFAWLADLPILAPTTPCERIDFELRAIEDADPHTIDARLREVRRSAQAVDFELAGLLDEAARRRLHREFGLANFEQYVETRLGLRPRTVWSLLSIGRAVRRCCPLLGEAWKSGRVSTLAARILLPVVGTAGSGISGNADTDEQWIARAAMVTLRRLEAEVNWALDRRDELGAGTAALAIAPPPLDLDLAGHALAAVTTDQLQMRAQDGGPDPAAAGDHLGVEITFFAPESVIFLTEGAIHGLRHGFESRGRAFERMLALAMLEWMAAPRHRDPVFERDGWRCAVPGCSSRRNLHDHHVVFRSQGGDNARDNRITVCAAHHLHGLHRGRIRASGRAPHAIEWEIGIRFGFDAGRSLARLVGDRYVEGR